MDITLVLVTLLSLLVAAVMTAFAWRLAQDERRREQARVNALSAEIHLDDWPLRGGEEPAGDVTLRSDLFTDSQTDRGPAPVNVRVAIALLFAVSVAAVVGVALLRARASAAATAPARVHIQSGSASPPEALPAAAPPLELTALTHDRDGDRLTVRGVVRNPASRPRVDHLTAVVALFNRDGEPVGSAGAAIDDHTLVPGSTSPFMVSIPNASDVARYRISFRTDGLVIPHVDRRGSAIMQAKQP